MIVVFHLSLVVIILTVLVTAMHADIPGGPIGAVCLGGVAVVSMAGFDQEPTPWMVGFTLCVAGVCAWIATRWRWSRRGCSSGAPKARNRRAA